MKQNGLLLHMMTVLKLHVILELSCMLADGVSELVDFEASFNKQYVKQKLGNGLVRIWHDVQARVSAYLLGSDLALYKSDDFLQVLRVVHRLVFLYVPLRPIIPFYHLRYRSL